MKSQTRKRRKVERNHGEVEQLTTSHTNKRSNNKHILDLYQIINYL